MPDIVGITEFIAADSSRYDTEKPYWAILGPGETLGEGIPFNNMEWETHELNLVDIRGRESEFGLKSCGFQIINHESGNLELDTPKLCQDYKQKTEVMLMSLFKANSVSCYDFCKRHNIPPKGSINNVSDILWEQGPALGLHNDVTSKSGLELLERFLSKDLIKKYNRPGYRFRIVNTWRPLLSVCEDRPLIFCDFRTLDLKDLIPADRILPDRAGEIYYVKYQKSQRWCWLEHQRPNEVLVLVMYDSHPELGEASGISSAT